MLSRSSLLRYVLVAAISAMSAMALVTTAVYAHNDGFNERIVACFDSRDPDSEQCRAGGDRLTKRLAVGGERGRNELLLAVLPAADVVEVVRARPKRVAGADRLHLELVPPPGRTAGENGDVPAVGVDVQVIREQVSDGDLHAAASSQYGRTNPRPATRSRSASIAV